jgi:hypothetical protein
MNSRFGRALLQDFDCEHSPYNLENRHISKFADGRPMKIGILRPLIGKEVERRQDLPKRQGVTRPRQRPLPPLNYYKETLVSCDCLAAQ